jgi:hypothetical protein
MRAAAVSPDLGAEEGRGRGGGRASGGVADAVGLRAGGVSPDLGAEDRRLAGL